jgi:hypothetical protein
MALESQGHGAIRTWRLEEARRFYVEAAGQEVGPEARVDNLLLNRAAASPAGEPVAALRHADRIERPPLMTVDAKSSRRERSGVSTS